MPPRRSSGVAGGFVPVEDARDLPEVPSTASRNRTRRVEVGRITNVADADQDENPVKESSVVDRKRKRVDDVASSSTPKTDNEIEDAVNVAFDRNKDGLLKLLEDRI
ncbi:hypothetical protein TSUD_34760 [Trifolium subterraneum]|uniref:Uncharacterized protein n=1 Tax=Trifolium subterraneum TaxID=3900 RepID=A0A2Z6LW64_TRISU|nr:hypothetical protein TSUD_34760 [Trifolium subterraneum]